jgi:hypothetical protein
MKTSGRPLNPDRQNAIDLGLKTYIGMTHPKCGTNVRYLGGSCVHCGKVASAEQRETRKYLKQQANVAAVVAEMVDRDIDDDVTAEDVEMMRIENAEIEIDNRSEDDLEDDAEARRQASIDDLM